MHVMTEDSSARPQKKRNERTCAGCGKHAPAEELVRVVHDPGSNAIAIDLANSAFGRGGHVHPSEPCLAKAAKGGFAKAFKAQVVCDAKELASQIVAGADRRIEGLLTGARRAGQVAVGGDVVAEALDQGRASLVLVARDAAAAAKLSPIERAIASGKAIAWSTKKRLGSLMGRDEVAVIAVLQAGVAGAVSHTYQLSGPFRGSSEGSWSSSEVR
jgi:predicted RNA-binding protein YlxR (DUF448 family)/ribosomal protein L7Ae-like RNA K-turn-binding protein